MTSAIRRGRMPIATGRDEGPYGLRFYGFSMCQSPKENGAGTVTVLNLARAAFWAPFGPMAYLD